MDNSNESGEGGKKSDSPLSKLKQTKPGINMGLLKLNLSERLKLQAEKQRKAGGAVELFESYDIRKESPLFSGVFKRAFNFYGGFLTLSTKERENFAESKTVKYYQSCVMELEEALNTLGSEITLLKDLNLKYVLDISSLREKVKKLELRERELE